MMLLSNNKSSRLLLITVLITSMATLGILSNITNAVHAKEGCEVKKWSDCKGEKGWYTKNGHHHCFPHLDKDCIHTGDKGNNYK